MNCTVVAGEDAAVVTCGDTVVRIPYGSDGSAGAAGGDGADGADGADGVGCTADPISNGVVVTCPGGSTTIMNGADGTDGAPCSAASDATTLTITCGEDEVAIPLAGPTCAVAPNGNADATNAIQDCIDEMGVLGGGTVLLHGGEYLLQSNHLRFEAGMHDYVHLKGAGPQTVLRLDAGLRRSAILIGADVADLGIACPPPYEEYAVAGVRIEGLRIVGNLGEPTDCCPGPEEGWQTPNGRWLTCEAYGATYTANPYLPRNGINIRCATDVTIADVTIDKASSGGVVADRALGLVVERTRINEPLVDCFASNFTEGTIVREMTCYRPGWSGLNGDPATHLTFEGNTISETGTLVCPGVPSWEKPGIYLVSVTGSTVTNNIITDSSGPGIELHGSDRNIITENHIEGSIKAGIALDVLRNPEDEPCLETDGSDDNVLVGNVIVDGAERPIWNVCPSLGNVASGNVCAGNLDDAALVSSNSDCGTTCDNQADALDIVAGCGG